MTYVAKYAAEAGIDFRSLFGVVMVETSGRSWWERIGNPLCEPAPCDSTGPSNLHPDVFTETVDAHPSLRGLYPKDFLPDWSNKARDEAVWASLSGSEFLEIAIATTAYRLKDLEGIAYVLMGEGKREGYDVSDAVPVSDLAIGMYLGEDKTNPAKSAFPNNRGKGTVKTKGTLEGVPKGYLKLVQGFYGAAEELFCSRGSGFTCTGL
jgi:hypothetical protein